MRPEAQKFKRPQRTPPPPASVASTCTRCCGEIDEDDEFLVDLCTVCDTLRHRELAAAKRESAEKGWCGGGSPQPPPCEPRLPVSPDSVMAGLQAMRVGRGISPPATEPSDGPATDDETHLDSRGQQSLQPPPRRQRSAHRSATLQWDPDAQEFTQTCREDDGMPAVASTPAPAPAAAPKPKQKAAAAPLPEGWKEYVDKSTGKSYYYNASTSTTTWERPAASGRASSSTEVQIPTHKTSHSSVEDDESEEESGDEGGAAKRKLPSWANPKELMSQLQQQDNPTQGDDVFGQQIHLMEEACALKEIFGSEVTNKRHHRRGSSGCWDLDRLTEQEEQAYQKSHNE